MSWFSDGLHFLQRGAFGITDSVLGTNLVGDYDSKKNFDLAKANLDWQKYVQNKTWEREDNAVQRRAADLRAAGINPLLAAGQSANAGAVVSTTAPQRQTAKYSTAEKLALAVGIDKTLAEIGVMGATKQNLIEQNNNIKAQNDLIKAQTIKAVADATGWTTEEATFKLFGSGYTYSSKQPNNKVKRPLVAGTDATTGELSDVHRYMLGWSSR